MNSNSIKIETQPDLGMLAIRFALRLNVGIGLVRGDVDADEAYGDAVRLEVASSLGVPHDRLLLHGVRGGGGVIDLTLR